MSGVGYALNNGTANNNANYVSVPASATLNNLNPWTFYFWGVPSLINSVTGNNGRLFNKGSLAGPQIRLATASSLTEIDANQIRSIASANYRTNDHRLVEGVRTCIVVVCDLSATNSFAIYIGLGTNPLTESTYGTTTNGSGTLGDNSAVEIRLGNVDGTANRGWVGSWWIAGLWGAAWTLAEARANQFAPPINSSCRGLWMGGANGLGPVLDLSGNGNHGTIVGGVSSAETLPMIGTTPTIGAPVPQVPAGWDDSSDAMAARLILESILFAS